tara:strand:- start:86 stop:463 length:378 start_codon:yes stop_codon:yes gene_type:complete
MYKVFIGFTHPRMQEVLSNKEITYYDICDKEIDTHIFINLMDELVNNRSKKIDFVFEDFFTSRAIDLNCNNKLVNNIKKFYEAFKYNFDANKKNGTKFYLLKVKDDIVHDVINFWYGSGINYREK